MDEINYSKYMYMYLENNHNQNYKKNIKTTTTIRRYFIKYFFLSAKFD